MRKVMMSRPHLTKKQARTCKSVQKIIKTRFFVDNHEILLYFSFIDIISSSERLAAGKESGLNEQVERRQLSKCDYVAQELKTQIIAGKYRSGDQLPPEPALCEMFSVSRITVREALKKLSMMGLVEIKQGKGTFVKSVDLGLFMKPMLQLVDFDEIDIETIYSAREYIEGGIAYLAAQQRTDGELAILARRLKSLNGETPVISCPFLNTTARSMMILPARRITRSCSPACRPLRRSMRPASSGMISS